MKSALILAPHDSFGDEGFSLNEIVFNQVRALRADGYKVIVACRVQPLRDEEKAWVGADILSNCLCYVKTPEEIAAALNAIIAYHGVSVVVTHDIMLTETYIAYALAMYTPCFNNAACVFIHLLHSHPPNRTDAEIAAARRGDKWAQASVPQGHLLAFPTSPASSVTRLARHYNIDRRRVVLWQNHRDPYRFFVPGDVRSNVQRIAEKYDMLNARRIVKTFPACSSRLENKGLYTLAGIFNEVGRACPDTPPVCLICNSNTASNESAINKYKAMCPWLVFTSDEVPAWIQHVPRAAVSAFMQFSKVFVHPSFNESSSLIAKEASMCGSLCVLNEATPAFHQTIARPALVPLCAEYNTTPELEAAQNKEVACRLVAHVAGGSSRWDDLHANSPSTQLRHAREALRDAAAARAFGNLHFVT